MAQNNTSLTVDPITQLYDVALTLRKMHEKFGDMYPELKHTWYSLERSLNNCITVLDSDAVDEALKKPE